MKNYRPENARAEKLYPSERTNDNFSRRDCPQIPFPLPPMVPGPPSVYSRDGVSGTGTTGSVVKMRVPGSISRATALNSPSPTASQRTDPAKSDVSAAGNIWSMNRADNGSAEPVAHGVKGVRQIGAIVHAKAVSATAFGLWH